jgi:Uma2 family endonuclease
MTTRTHPSHQRSTVAGPRFTIADIPGGPTTLVPRLTVPQYYDLMAQIGLGGQSQWELIDGYIRLIDRSGPDQQPTEMGPFHKYVCGMLSRHVLRFDGLGCHLDVQTDVLLDDDSAPIPDGAVVVGHPADYLSGHPTPEHTLCIIEVADSSLGFDLGEKLARYAAAGERMYVVIRVRERSAVVFTDPSGEGYRTSRELTEDDILRLPTATETTVDVPLADLLPPPSATDEELPRSS